MLYHFSVALCNSNNEYLLGEIKLPDEKHYLAFIGFDIEGFDLYEAEDLFTLIISTVHDIAGVEICDLGDPIDIANGVLFPASDEAGCVTGAEPVIDCGCMAH